MPTSSVGQVNWRGDAMVVDVKAGARGVACGWGTGIGETRQGVSWNITIADMSVSLDEDMSNWPTDDVPYSGQLDGQSVSARYSNGESYLQYICQFKGGTLDGRFNADFSTLDATETLTWGPPGAETIVQRRWIVRRLPAPPVPE